MAGNKIELWGRILGEPELRTTPAGTAVLRIMVDCADGTGELALAVQMTGEAAHQVAPGIKTGSLVRVHGSVKAIRRRLKSGQFETGYEVMAASITVEK